MSGAPSRAIALFGTEEPVADTIRLRAGPLACTLDAGNLRHLCVAGREAIRAISFVVRDRNWATYPPAIADLAVDQRPDGFSVTYAARCADAVQALRYSARIEGKADGSLEFSAEARPETDFVTNRSGFVVLHGVEGIAGAELEVEHTDGRIERTRFPPLVSPSQPVFDIRVLTHEVRPGVRVSCRMEGDAYEMEDQRNWLDASYKTYIRPLAKPWGYTLPAGEPVAQRVSVEVHGRVLDSAVDAAAVEIAVGAPNGLVMPRLGVAIDRGHVDSALALANTVAAARPGFLVGHVDLRSDGADTLAAYRELAQHLGAELVVEAVLPLLDAAGAWTDAPAVLEADLSRLTADAATAGVKPDRLIVWLACYMKSYQPDGVWPKAPPLQTVYEAARQAFPGARIGGGSPAYFTELNRKRPPAEALDFIGHAVCPLVHAGDDDSLTEGLEALPTMIATTRAFAAGRPCWLYPSAISMRANPYGAAPVDNPANIRTAMSRNDPRERALIGAAWYAGLLAHAARGGLGAVTIGAAAGPSGLAHAPMPWPQPWYDGRGGVFPGFHVFHQHARFAGERQLATTTSAPRDVQALAFTSPTGPRLWLVNLTPEPREVRITGLEGRRAHAHRIDEESFVRLSSGAGAFDQGVADCPLDRADLEPYAAIRIDAFP